MLGGGEKGVQGAGRGLFLLRIPVGGEGLPGGWGRGGRVVGGCLRGIWAGGGKYFFSGPKFPPTIGQQ